MLHHRVVLIGLALAVASGAIASCGGDDDVSVGEGPGTAVETTPTTPTTTTTTLDPDSSVSSPIIVDPSAPGGGGAQRVEPRPGMANVRPQPFLNTTETPPTATDGGVLVQFYGGVAPCYVFDHYEVEETPETVTITLYAGSDPADPNGVCIEIAALYEVFVPLEAPLGDRTIIDGAA